MKGRYYIPHYKALLTLGIPIIIGQLGQIVVGFADSIMIGRYSTEALSAAGFVNSMINLCIIFCMGFSYGFLPLMGQAYGRGEHRRLSEILRNCFPASLSLWVIVAAVMGVFYFFIPYMGQPETLIPAIQEYYLIQYGSLLFVILFYAFKQFSDTIGDTQASMWIILIGNVLNIIGNWLLIYGVGPFPELGLNGAGLSTLFARFIMVVLFTLLFFRTRRYAVYRDFFKEVRAGRELFRMLHAKGWPVAVEMGLETAAFSFTAVMLGWISATALAANQIIITISTVCYLIYYGIGSAAAVRVSHYYGQGEYRKVRDNVAAAFHLSMASGFVMCLLIYLLRYPLIGCFTTENEVIETTVLLIWPFFVYQFGDGLQICYANGLRGIGDVKPLMGYAFFSFIVIGIPCSYALAFICGWGAVGVWAGLPFGLTTAGLLFYRRFLSSSRTKRAV